MTGRKASPIKYLNLKNVRSNAPSFRLARSLLEINTFYRATIDTQISTGNI